MAGPDVRCVVEARDKLGEGVFWSAEDAAVYWLDVPPPARIHRYTPATGRHETWDVPEPVASMARMADGRLLVAGKSGLHVFDPGDGSLKLVAAPEADRPHNRSNDGAPDGRGRFWYGTMRNNMGPKGEDLEGPQPSVGTLYKVEPDLRVVPMEHGIGIPNATAFSPDFSVMYFADTLAGTIFAYDFDLELGALSNKRVFTTDGPGHPDGACVDAHGYLWNARWEGSAVVRFDPKGRVDRIIEVPADRLTCCAFGGPDLATLYVTSSWINIPDDRLARQPLAGGLFALEPGVAGVRRPLFGPS